MRYSIRAVADAADAAAVHALMVESFVLGRPLPIRGPSIDRYVTWCVDWYLGDGRRWASVIDDGEAIVGYVIVCGDEVGWRRHLRRRGAAYVVRLLPVLVWPGTSRDVRRFHLLRFRDSWALRKGGRADRRSVHVHVNLAPQVRLGQLTGSVRAHCDAVCGELAAEGWTGEINARVGHRAAALERLGGQIVDRHPNHTLTWLVGAPVERLTVWREVLRPLPTPVRRSDGEAAMTERTHPTGDGLTVRSSC